MREIESKINATLTGLHSAEIMCKNRDIRTLKA